MFLLLYMAFILLLVINLERMTQKTFSLQ